jgi:sigma-E factor negative regulatory protein RseC
MQETGIVREVVGPKAIVAVQKQSGCESCPGGSVCKSLGAGEGLVEALNEARANVGDSVKISFKPYTYLKGSILVYGLPALMLIIGAVIGKEYLPNIITGIDPDIASAIGGFGLFIFSFIIMKILSNRFEAKKEYMPVITEILK